jgi:hypothetical protein
MFHSRLLILEARAARHPSIPSKAYRTIGTSQVAAHFPSGHTSSSSYQAADSEAQEQDDPPHTSLPQILSEILQLMLLTDQTMEEKLEVLRAVRYSSAVGVTGCEVAAIKRRAIGYCAYMAPHGSAIASFRALLF